jgi:hypothetical protein
VRRDGDDEREERERADDGADRAGGSVHAMPQGSGHVPRALHGRPATYGVDTAAREAEFNACQDGVYAQGTSSAARTI